jgi:hypothetical protein
VELTLVGDDAPIVDGVGWSDDTVWIDAKRGGKRSTSGGLRERAGFRGVPHDVWEFHLGGYQVCEKWLKDRRGRALTEKDIVHYHRIVIGVHETIRLMREIDEAIDASGGWPGAFAQG